MQILKNKQILENEIFQLMANAIKLDGQQEHPFFST